MNQDQDNFPGIATNAIQLSRKSWTAYVGIAVRIVLLLGLAGATAYWQPEYWGLIALILGVALLFVVYQILLLRSYRLYYNEAGVWIYSGVLPWKRGVSGVKWRDLDEAIFVNDFWSWISRSYTVQLKHRFTKAIEISEPGMAQGKQSVIAINQQHLVHIAAERGATTLADAQPRTPL